MLTELRSIVKDCSVSITEQNQFCWPKAEKPYYTATERDEEGMNIKVKSV